MSDLVGAIRKRLPTSLGGVKASPSRSTGGGGDGADSLLEADHTAGAEAEGNLEVGNSSGNNITINGAGSSESNSADESRNGSTSSGGSTRPSVRMMLATPTPPTHTPLPDEMDDGLTFSRPRTTTLTQSEASSLAQTTSTTQAPSSKGEQQQGDGSDDSDDERWSSPRKEGVVMKWTNYITGWQNRYLVLADGTLSYYKNKEEVSTCCRGTIDVAQAELVPHQFDELRFDVSFGEQTFHLRGNTLKDRDEWMDVLMKCKTAAAEHGTGLMRRNSALSLTSIASSASAGPSIRSRTLQDKISELHTFRDALVKQTHDMQTALAELTKDDSILQAKPLLSDFKAESLAFKATSTGMSQALDECLELIKKREEEWQQRYNRVNERRKRVEQQYKELKNSKPVVNVHPFYSPDFVEGPHMKGNEEEFFDALETRLDQLDEELDRESEFTRRQILTPKPASSNHRFSTLLDEKVQASCELAAEDPESSSAGWETAHQDGEMKVYRREVEDNGILCDRMKAYHVVDGVSGLEMAQYFWDVKYRMEWELTVDLFFVLEHLDPETLIVHNVHKRVWPSAQRDSCFVSHFRKLNNGSIIVQNLSVDHESAPESYVRVIVNVFMMTKTVIKDPHKPPTRDNIACKLTYIASINPGGWIPPAALRAVSKREYPRFLRSISERSQLKFASEPVVM
eukprot:m.148864 g.148864  ORF g.148864 m.148864 type:complete len:684 (-) comp16842_c2_seq1:443-2494(-)